MTTFKQPTILRTVGYYLGTREVAELRRIAAGADHELAERLHAVLARAEPMKQEIRSTSRYATEGPVAASPKV